MRGGCFGRPVFHVSIGNSDHENKDFGRDFIRRRNPDRRRLFRNHPRTGPTYATRQVIQTNLKNLPGQQVLLFASTRQPGFRSPLHMHPEGRFAGSGLIQQDPTSVYGRSGAAFEGRTHLEARSRGGS